MIFALVPLAVLVFLWASLRFGAAVRAVDHTHANIDTIVDARSAMRQSREALHAWLRTGDPEQLAAYKAGADTAWRQAWKFKENTLDNSRQVVNAERFENRLGETFKLGDALIAENRAGHPRDAQARVAAEDATNDGLRKAIGEVVDEERRQLAMHEATLAASVRTVQVVAVVFGALMLLLAYRSWIRIEAVLALGERR
ncbi:MAG TPA: CHASE3 domain-containing protein [Myxococcales bacterium]|jgi:CHASE3 domain sensor protein